MSFIRTSLHYHPSTQPDRHHILTHPHSTTTHTADSVNEIAVRFLDLDTTGLTSASMTWTTDSSAISDRRDSVQVEHTQTGPPLNLLEPVINDHVDDAILQISGAGH